MPYRNDSSAAPLACPRCQKPLPPLDVAACGCGTWVSAFAATEVLRPEELRRTYLHWWKVKAPCPMCGEKMVLRGDAPGLFLGCDGHGFWIDADTLRHTGLVRGVDLDALERKRSDEERVTADREVRWRAEQERAEANQERQRREAQLNRQLGTWQNAEPASLDAPKEAAPVRPSTRSSLVRIAELEAQIRQLSGALDEARAEAVTLATRVAAIERALDARRPTRS